LANGAYAPQVAGTDARDGSAFALSEFLGDSRVHPTKAAIVSFSASWCGPCRASLPQLAELKSQHGDELLVLIVSIDEGTAGLRAEVRAVEEAGLDAPIILADEALQRAWLGDTRNIPHLFIVNQVGEVLVQDRGYGSNVQRVLPRQLGYALSHPEYVERD
jgi:thiol-disulfide isomerase/thioredoxin